MGGREEVSGSVLRVVDRSLLVAIPLLVLSIIIGGAASALMWSGIGVCALLIIGALERFDAKWRAGGYAVIAMIAANLALWSMGPLTGVGVQFAMSILFAGAFMPRRGLIACLVFSIASITIRTCLANDPNARMLIPANLWLSSALAVAVSLWMATRVLRVLLTSLERSYATAVAALELEKASRAQLESSRAELEELAQVEMVGRLAGGVAHDINNALASILAASEVLAEEVTTPAQRRDLAELEAASQYAGDLVRDLLWTGRRFPPSTKDVAGLGAVLRVCRERVGRIARAVEISAAIDPSLQVAMAPEHLEQILFGLIVGLDRSGATRLDITSTRSGDWLGLELVGRGLLSTDRSRAVQIRLGVSAARELVTSYGGEQQFEEHDDRIVVRLQLPLSVDLAATSLRISEPIRTALVVEDEPMVLRRLCKLASQRGYEVQAASSVAEGLALLASKPDLLITDMQLPDGSGREIALAAFAQNPSRPIIVCSGFSAEDVRAGVLQNAPLVLLPKPFTNAAFEAAVRARST